MAKYIKKSSKNLCHHNSLKNLIKSEYSFKLHDTKLEENIFKKRFDFDYKFHARINKKKKPLDSFLFSINKFTF